MFIEFLKKISITEVMASPVITVRETDDFHVVEDKFAVYDIRHLPVIDERGAMVGMITQRDLYKIHSPRKLEDGGWFYDKEQLDNFILSKVMTREIITLKAENTLFDAIDLTVRQKIGCIPIVDGLNKPIGIITRDRILKYFLTK